MAMSSNFNLGVRHLLPIVPLLAVGVGCAVHRLANHRLQIAATGLLIWQVVVVVLAYPLYIQFFSEAVGGARNGYKYLCDSNYDWGQDITRLGAWVRANHIDRIYTDVFADVPVRYYLGRAHEGYSILWNGLPPSGSYVAVSANVYENNVTDPKIPPEKKYSLLKDHLVTRIGKSIFVFRIP